MIYLVQMKDGTSSVVEKKDFNTVDIDGVEKVYTANYEVRVVTELVPEGEEAQQFSEVIASFEQKYQGNVVVPDGLQPFTDWFSSAATGEAAYIPEKVLVPVKTYKVMRVKSGVASPDVASVSAKKVAAPPVKKEEAPKVAPVKSQKPAKKKKKEESQAGLFDTETPKKKTKRKK